MKSKHERGFTSYKQCEGVIDEHFGFLNESQWNNYFADESASNVTEDRQRNNQITDLDMSTDDYESVNVRDKLTLQQVKNEAINKQNMACVPV